MSAMFVSCTDSDTHETFKSNVKGVNGLLLMLSTHFTLDQIITIKGRGEGQEDRTGSETETGKNE